MKRFANSFSVFLLLLISVTAILAGCGDKSGTTDPDRQVLHRGNVAEPDTLDPQKVTTIYEVVITRDLFNSLVQYNAKAEIIPGSAERWDISEDGLTYTFHLRENLKWSDGTNIVAEDWVAGFRRFFNPMTAAPSVSLAYMILNGEEVARGHKPVEELAVRAVDDHTLEVRLANPSPSFFPILANPWCVAFPRHVYAEHGDKWSKPGNMVSSGPFMLADWIPNDHVRVVKNPHFYDADTVALDEIYYYPTEDYSAAIKRFRAGELDMNTQFPTEQYSLLKEKLPEETLTHPNMSVGYIVINHKRAPYNDLRVRRAMTMSIDREVLTTRILTLGEKPAYRFTSYGVTGYKAEDVAFKDRDIEDRREEARQLLAEAGYGPDNPLKFEFRIRVGAENNRNTIAVVDMWKEIGIQAQMLTTDIKTHYADLYQHNFDVADAGWSSLNEPGQFLYLLRTETVQQNFGEFSHPEFDRLMKEADHIFDIEHRYAVTAKAEKIAMDEVAVIPLFFGVSRNLVGTHVKGFEVNVQDAHPSQYLSIERNG